MPDFLQPDEEVLWETKRRGASVLDDLLLVLVPGLALVGALIWFHAAVWPAGWFLVGVPGILVALVGMGAFLMQRIWRVKTSRYVVTPQRVYKAYGRIGYYLGQTTYDKVTDLHVKQSLFGRILGFGTLRLQTAGAGLALDGVDDPFRTKQTIEEARSRYIAILAGKAVQKDAPARTEEVLWQGQPSWPFFLGSLVSVGIVSVASMGVLIAGLVIPGAWPLIVFGGLGLLTSGLIVVGLAIHRKYTHYTVRSGGVVITSGWLTRRRVETTFEKVTDVTTYQGLLGRILGFGSITINTAGSNEAPVNFRGIEDPDGVKQLIDDARRQWK